METRWKAGEDLETVCGERHERVKSCGGGGRRDQVEE